MKTLSLNSEKNIKIALNHYPHKETKDALIICPGCFMCKDAKPFLDMSEDFSKYFNVITMDFRGHGKSSGLFTFTAREYIDLKAVVDYAEKECKYDRIFLLGFSLGAAISVIYTEKYKNINKVIGVSTPTDFDKIENHFLKKEAVLPAIEKFEFGKSPNIRPGNIALKKIKPIDIISDIAPIPILFISGKKDPIIHNWHAEKLFEKAQDPKKIVVFEDGFHAEDIFREYRGEFVDTCVEWYLD